METTWKTNTSPWALVQRKIATLLTAYRVHRSVQKLKQQLQKLPELDEEERKRRWEALHRKNAQLAFKHIHKYRGFLTKVGQSASTKSGELPAPWVEELSALQDQLPVSTFEEVQRTVQDDLGKPVHRIYSDFGERPIASASVAQAHVAHLRDYNTKVCVKVQHRGVAKLMNADLSTVEYLCRKAQKYHPETPDMTSLVNEWRRATQEEVDFVLEAENASRALNRLRKSGIDVGCPEPVAWCSGRRVLTMLFVEGWKITDVKRLPPNTDRSVLASKLVDAFATLAFQEGLIHGDPHPGNIFVEPVAADPPRVRPVILDWGIVRKLTGPECVAMAHWAIATMSRDRVLYLSTLRELGFLFKEDFEALELDDWLNASQWSLRDSIPSNSQLQFMEQLERQREELDEIMQQKNEGDPGKGDDGQARGIMVERVPGTVVFFLRGLEMLQGICGTLDVSIPVSAIILRQAVQLLETEKGVPSAPPITASVPADPADMEAAVHAKLAELSAAGAVLGAQVSVLSDGEAGAPGAWRCSLALGRVGIAAGPVSEASLMPLLDVGVGVLILLLLGIVSDSARTGQAIDAEKTRVRDIWPEFAQGGKGGITISQLLQHCAGLSRPFPRDMSFTQYCFEQKLEKYVAASPAAEIGSVSRVNGLAAAAILKRLTSHRTAASTVQYCLEPLALQEEIVYHGPEDGRMAYLGRELQMQLPMSRILERLEKRERTRGLDRRDRLPPWLSWHELGGALSCCSDPLMVNREEFRSGRYSSADRGLRANARALCRLYAAMPAPDLSQPRRLHTESRQEWEELSRCLEFGMGLQLFRFRQVEEGTEVVGYGYADGATGSVALRIPGFSIAILLNQVDEDSRHIGHEVLSVIAASLGLEPLWHLEGPHAAAAAAAAAARKQAEAEGRAHDGPAPLESSPEPDEPCDEEADAEDPGTAEVKKPPGLGGVWKSAETDGLDAVLDAFDVPAMARMFVRNMRRTLRIELDDNHITLSDTMLVAGQKMEDSKNSFNVGEPFEGEQQLGGIFRGFATWVDGDGDQTKHSLCLEKSIDVAGRSLDLVEKFALTPEGRLALTITLRGPGQLDFTVKTGVDRDRLCLSMDPDTLELHRDVDFGKDKAVKGGRVVGPVTSFDDLGTLPLPAVVSILYDDSCCTTMFDRPVSKVRRRTVVAEKVDGGGGGDEVVDAQQGDDDDEEASVTGTGAQASECATGLLLAGSVAAAYATSCLATAMRALGRALHAACQSQPAPARHQLTNGNSLAMTSWEL